MDELRTLYRYRQLIAALTSRDLKARYRGSVLGFFWSLANPLMLLAVYTLVFMYFFPADMKLYPLFLFSGILPWTFFSAAVLESTNAITGNAGLIKKVVFPAEALPLVVVLSHLVHFLLALPILLLAILVFAALRQLPVSMALLLAPVILLLQTIFVAGVALVVSSASVLFRDLRDLITNLMQLMFFLTPVIYSITRLNSPLVRALLHLNPMTPFVLSYQDIFFWARTPSPTNSALMVLYAAMSLALGFFVFERLRDTLAEAI
jgi:lipopolysaccharide transport system permease protein